MNRTETLLLSLQSDIKELKVQSREVMSSSQAAIYLNVSTSFLNHNKDIPKYVVGKIVRWRKSDLDKWLNQFRISTKEEINSMAEEKINSIRKRKTA